MPARPPWSPHAEVNEVQQVIKRSSRSAGHGLSLLGGSRLWQTRHPAPSRGQPQARRSLR